MSEKRPDALLAELAALPAGRCAVLLPATRPPEGPQWAWRTGHAVVQVVLAGRVPTIASGGGMIGPAVLRRGDVLVSLPGAWSRRSYATARRLVSVSLHPGQIVLEVYAYRPAAPRGGPPLARWPLRPSPALGAIATALACCSPAAAGHLGAALRAMLPEALIPVAAVDGAERVRAAAYAWLEQHALTGGGRTACAAALGVHPDHLTRVFRRAGGSWHAAVLARRLDQARRLLQAGEPVAAVARRCGWAGASHFIAVFRRRHGLSPERWRRQGAAE